MLNVAQDIAKVVKVVLLYTFEDFTIQALVIFMKIIYDFNSLLMISFYVYVTVQFEEINILTVLID